MTTYMGRDAESPELGRDAESLEHDVRHALAARLEDQPAPGADGRNLDVSACRETVTFNHIVNLNHIKTI